MDKNNRNVHFISIKGWRDQNEDSHNIILNMNDKHTNLNKINFLAVFDGHGGKRVSEYLQNNLYKYFMNKSVKYPLSTKNVTYIYDKIQKDLSQYDFSLHCGSTGLVVINYVDRVTNDEYLNIINNGDCRCVLCRDNFAMPLTKDHKPHWPEERCRIEQLGGVITFDDYDYRIKDLSVSRAFGDRDATPYVTHRPEVFRYKLDKSDKFIIVACDGLWDVLSNSDAVNFVIENCYDVYTGKRINQNVNISKKLTDYALKKGSRDNITVIVYFLK